MFRLVGLSSASSGSDKDLPVLERPPRASFQLDLGGSGQLSLFSGFLRWMGEDEAIGEKNICTESRLHFSVRERKKNLSKGRPRERDALNEIKR